MSQDAKLIHGDIRHLLITQTTPMILGVAAMMSIGLVDSYFIGQLGDAPLAAVGFVFPISVIFTSLGVGMAVGVNSVVSRALGAGDSESAGRRGSFGVVFAGVLGVVLGALLLLFMDPLFAAMQASEETLPLIREYMRIFAFALPVMMVIMGFNGMLRGMGEAKKNSYVSFTFAGVNILLDPLLIHGGFGLPGMGVTGAALASIIGWILAAILGFFMLRKTALPFQPLQALSCQFGPSLRALTSVAAPAAFANAINPLGLSIITALIATQSQQAVAGFGAAGRLQSFIIVPLLALSGTIGGIVGQNWGAKAYDRAKEAVRLSSLFCLFYGALVAVFLLWSRHWIAGIFSDDPEVTAQFANYLSISAWGFAGFGLLIVNNGALNAMGKAGSALLQSLTRVFVILLPAAWLLLPLWGLRGVYSAELIANLAGGTIAAMVIWSRFSSDKLPKKSPEQQHQAPSNSPGD